MGKMVITAAGIAEVVNAENTGTAPVVLSHIAFGTGQYTATVERTALQAEFKRFETISGGGVGNNVFHVTMEDDSTDAYTVYEVGVFTESGTLFAVYSQNTSIIQKSAGSIGMLAVDILLDEMNPASVTIGDTNFQFNPATTERKGVIEIATEAEAKAGTDTKRAITPATLDKVIEGHDNIVHRGGSETIAGSKTFTGNLIVSKTSPFLLVTQNQIDKGTTPGSTQYMGISFTDKNGHATENRLGLLETRYLADGGVSLSVSAYKPEKGSTASAGFEIIYPASGSPYATAPTPAAGDNSTKIATTAWVTQKAKEYLPLAGGKMSGGIYSSQDSARFVIGGGTNYDKGGHIVLNGKDSTNNPGGFELITHDGTKTMAFYGKKDGSLTWCGKNIVRSVNNVSADAAGNVSITSISGNAGTATKLQTAREINLTGDVTGSAGFDGSGDVSISVTVKDNSHNHSNYLPLAGGTMTGAITLDGNASIFAADRDLWLSHSSGNTAYRAAMLAGDDYNTGASLYMHGMDYEPNPGQFSLRAHNGETGAALIGKPDGSLTWMGKDVLTEETGIVVVETWKSSDGLSWYRKWSDGWIEQGGVSNTSNITLPVEMADNKYWVIANPDIDSTTAYAAQYWHIYQKTTTTFKVGGENYVETGMNHRWIVMGYAE